MHKKTNIIETDFQKENVQRLYEHLSNCKKIDIEGAGLTLLKGNFILEQVGYRYTKDEKKIYSDEHGAWRKKWWVIGHDILLHDPIFVDIDNNNPKQA